MHKNTQAFLFFITMSIGPLLILNKYNLMRGSEESWIKENIISDVSSTINNAKETSSDQKPDNQQSSEEKKDEEIKSKETIDKAVIFEKENNPEKISELNKDMSKEELIEKTQLINKEKTLGNPDNQESINQESVSPEPVSQELDNKDAIEEEELDPSAIFFKRLEKQFRPETEREASIDDYIATQERTIREKNILDELEYELIAQKIIIETKLTDNNNSQKTHISEDQKKEFLSHIQIDLKELSERKKAIDQELFYLNSMIALQGTAQAILEKKEDLQTSPAEKKESNGKPLSLLKELAKTLWKLYPDKGFFKNIPQVDRSENGLIIASLNNEESEDEPEGQEEDETEEKSNKKEENEKEEKNEENLDETIIDKNAITQKAATEQQR